MARKPRRFVLGDIHGEYDYLVEVLKKSGIDPEIDLLIQIGDIVDRGSEPFKCMDELLKFKNLVLIEGNHDQGFKETVYGRSNLLAAYPSNGVEATMIRWREFSGDQRIYYKEQIFDKLVPYHVTEDNILFVHGGFDNETPIEKQSAQGLAWDRELVGQMAQNFMKKKDDNLAGSYKQVYIGHTPTLYFGLLQPFGAGNVCLVDTGSGKGGPLTIVDIDTQEFWQSDFSDEIKQYVQEIKTESSGEEEKQKTEEGTPEEEIARAA